MRLSWEQPRALSCRCFKRGLGDVFLDFFMVFDRDPVVLKLGNGTSPIKKVLFDLMWQLDIQKWVVFHFHMWLPEDRCFDFRVTKESLSVSLSLSLSTAMYIYRSIYLPTYLSIYPSCVFSCFGRMAVGSYWVVSSNIPTCSCIGGPHIAECRGFRLPFPEPPGTMGENNAMVALWPCVCQVIRPTNSLPALEIRISSSIQSMPDAVAAVLAGSRLGFSCKPTWQWKINTLNF